MRVDGEGFVGVGCCAFVDVEVLPFMYRERERESISLVNLAPSCVYVEAC